MTDKNYIMTDKKDEERYITFITNLGAKKSNNKKIKYKGPQLCPIQEKEEQEFKKNFKTEKKKFI